MSRMSLSRRLATSVDWSIHRLLRATPSSTDRTMSALVVAMRDRLWNLPRPLRSSIGDRSPLSHGANSTLFDPGTDDAASAAQLVVAQALAQVCPAATGSSARRRPGC